MKERLMTLLTALAALALVIFLLSPQKQNQPKPVSVPTSEDSGADGLKGLFTWLQREELAVTSYRKRYTDLYNDKNLPDNGNVLIASMPASRAVRETEWQDLADWLDRGNTLIILGAVYLHPRWMSGEDCFCDVKKFLSRYEWHLATAELDADSEGKADATPSEEDGRKTLQAGVDALKAGLQQALPQDNQLLALSSHPLLQDVHVLQTQTRDNLLKKPWTLTADEPDMLSLRLFEIAGSDTAAGWWMNAGGGRIVLLLTPDVFSNSRLGQADNARFLANVLGQSLSQGGRLLFDDYHFGLSELYDPEHFFKDQRLHNTLWCLAIFWMLYVAGYTTRLAPVRQAGARLSAQDFIMVVAEFFARRLSKAVLAEALVKHLLTDIHTRRGFGNEQEVWHWLEQHSRVSSEQIALLKRALAKQRLSLQRLSNTITYIRTVTL